MSKSRRSKPEPIKAVRVPSEGTDMSTPARRRGVQGLLSAARELEDKAAKRGVDIAPDKEVLHSDLHGREVPLKISEPLTQQDHDRYAIGIKEHKLRLEAAQAAASAPLPEAGTEPLDLPPIAPHLTYGDTEHPGQAEELEDENIADLAEEEGILEPESLPDHGFMNATDRVFKDIRTEVCRTYTYPEGDEITFDLPVYLSVSPSGTHYLFLENGDCVCIAPGWRCITWKTKPGYPHFVV